MRRPNIILILADDMGYGDIGALGNPDVRTPNLDFLFSEGICLTQHYSGSPVCAPARAAIMTGRYPHRTGAIDTLEGRGLDRLSLNEVTLADVLKSVGYATGLIGKWHLGALDPRYHPNARGFDEFLGFRGGWHDYWKWRLDCNGSVKVSDGRYLTDVFTEAAVDFIRRHSNHPFFLHVAFNAPHFPFQAPEEDVSPFREKGKFTEAVCLIYGMNRRMDAGIGCILEELDRLNLSANTLLIFASDNGPQFGGEGDDCTTRFNGYFNGSKGLTYEGGIRVPSVIHWPDGLEGKRQLSYVVHFMDWLPTLAEIAGAELPSHPVDGTNIVRLLRGEEPSRERVLFWQWNRYSPVRRCNAAVRAGCWKLICPAIKEAMWLRLEDLEYDRKLKYDPDNATDISRDPEPEREIPAPPAPLLFNIEDDPYETTDLSATHPDLVSRLLGLLDKWFEEVEAERQQRNE